MAVAGIDRCVELLLVLLQRGNHGNEDGIRVAGQSIVDAQSLVKELSEWLPLTYLLIGFLVELDKSAHREHVIACVTIQRQGSPVPLHNEGVIPVAPIGCQREIVAVRDIAIGG